MSSTEQMVMREADWTSLVYAVERGMCTLMLGPDAVTGTLQGVRLPVHRALATYIKAQLGPAHAHLDAAKLASVAQAAVAHEDPFSVQGWVEEFYDEFQIDDSVLRQLAALSFDLVINSSPGLSVDSIYQAVKPGTSTDFYDRTARARPTLPDRSTEAPLLYQLYGSLKRPSSLILSDSDRLDFIVSVVSDEPPLPPKLRSALCDPGRSFLFLGFDLAQWQFRVLLHVLSGEVRRRYKSFALELSDDLDLETRDFYRSGHKIHFLSGDLDAFVRELSQRVRVSQPAPTADDGLERSDTVAPDAPVVFLCHASEDSARVQRVAAGLRRNGIATWFDREDIRGGDRWDARVRRTISEEVDYVVVVQSASLVAKDVGYVNREIGLALDRQELYRAPRCFVIPALLDGAEHQLGELDHLQSVDLTHSDGLDSLVRAIRRDLSYKVRQST